MHVSHMSMLLLLLTLGVAASIIVQGQSLEAPVSVAADSDIDQTLAVDSDDIIDPMLVEVDQLGEVESTQQEDDGSLETAAQLWRKAKREGSCIYMKKKLVACNQSGTASNKPKNGGQKKNSLKYDGTANSKYDIEGPDDDEQYKQDSKAKTTKYSGSSQNKDKSGDKYDSKHGGSSSSSSKKSTPKQTGSGSSSNKPKHTDSDYSSEQYGDAKKYSSSKSKDPSGDSSSSSSSSSGGSSGSKSSSGSSSSSNSSNSKGDYTDKSEHKSTKHKQDADSEEYGDVQKHSSSRSSSSSKNKGTTGGGSSSSKTKGDYTDKFEHKSTKHNQDEDPEEEYWVPPLEDDDTSEQDSTSYEENSHSGSKTGGYKKSKSTDGEDEEDTDQDFWQPRVKHSKSSKYSKPRYTLVRPHKGQGLINSLYKWAAKYASYAESLVQEPGLVKTTSRTGTGAEQL